MLPSHIQSHPYYRLALALLSLVYLAASPLAAQELVINELTTGDQQSPDVAALPNGGFIVVWQSTVTPGSDADGSSILGRTLDSSGAPTSGDFQLNTYTTLSQRRPRVDARQDGSFVVAWIDNVPAIEGLFENLRARAFDSLGNGLPSDLLVDTSDNIDSHDVAAADSGQFVVVNSRFYYEYGGGFNGRARIHRFQSDGTEISSNFLIPGGSQVVTVGVDGSEAHGFVVATSIRPYYGVLSEIEARRLDAEGAPDGSSIDLYSDQPSSIGSPTGANVAVDPSGAFVVAWNGRDYPSTESEIFGRHVDAMNVLEPTGPQQINTYTTGFQSPPSLARGGDGTFLVVWEDPNPPGDSTSGIRGRRLDSLGAPLGEAFGVNVDTAGGQSGPRVVASADGSEFLVVWTSSTGTNGAEIRGRRFTLPSLFQDGFESGDVSRWSSSVP